MESGVCGDPKIKKIKPSWNDWRLCSPGKGRAVVCFLSTWGTETIGSTVVKRCIHSVCTWVITISDIVSRGEHKLTNYNSASAEDVQRRPSDGIPGKMKVPVCGIFGTSGADLMEFDCFHAHFMQCQANCAFLCDSKSSRIASELLCLAAAICTRSSHFQCFSLRPHTIKTVKGDITNAYFTRSWVSSRVGSTESWDIQEIVRHTELP